MKKTLLTSMLAIGIITQASAANFYLGGRMSYSHNNISGMKTTLYAPDDDEPSILHVDRNTVKGDSFGSVRGKIAAGLALPADHLHGAFRVEAEFGLSTKEEFKMVVDGENFPNDPAQLKLGKQTFFVNAYYDFNATNKIKPYAGLGIGLARVKVDMNWAAENPSIPDLFFFVNESANLRNFAWNLGFGVAYSLTDNIALDLGYRFTDMGKIDLQTVNMVDATELGGDIFAGSTMNITTNLRSHEVLFGVRYAF